ncbi:MAG: 16S rRNA (cytidine(1402)-2'-O)-methyltransferase [bacterium]|nr:16S rRNA (cytidine(1402)-2'-O)-methyltransferase [bacterium]
MGTLYIVATPIGNLEDITLRALRILKDVDIIFCEDTRVTRTLLSYYEITTKTESYHAHSKDKKTERIIALLNAGGTLALVSDAGTPGISDPGVELVREIRELNSEEIHIEVIPGPSALTSALSVAGVPTTPMTFFGFPPHKKGRKTFFDVIASTVNTIVFYESTHRIEKALNEINDREPTRQLVLVKELSKMHETVARGTAREILEWLSLDTARTKGEFVVVVEPQK